MNKKKESAAHLGLCADCRHMRHITSDRGSNFYLCQLSAADANFPKYPRLPVWRCSGHATVGVKEQE